MNNPQQEIEGLITRLCTANRKDQEVAIKQHFTSDASFSHPFCSVTSNRDKIIYIYQWYKILSPNIEVSVNAVGMLSLLISNVLECAANKRPAYDQQNAILFANVSQTFKIWFIPAYLAKVKLTTVLHLVKFQNDAPAAMGSDGLSKFLIKSQEDLYQTNEFVKFFLPWSIGTTIIGIWHYIATMLCVYGANGYIAIATIFSGIAAFFAGREAERQAVNSEPSTDVTKSESGDPSGAIEDDLRRDSGRVKDGTNGHGNVVAESAMRKRSVVQSGKKDGVGIGDLERKSNLGQSKMK